MKEPFVKKLLTYLEDKNLAMFSIAQAQLAASLHRNQMQKQIENLKQRIIIEMFVLFRLFYMESGGASTKITENR